jgi:hypothetical protein
MTRRLIAAAGLGLLLASWAASSEEASEKTFPWDGGPDSIDVSGYPKEQQANYKVFVRKCSRCHTLARAINAPLALPEEWEAYVRKMQKKRRSGVDAKSAGSVISFLQYDSSVRKKDLLEKKSKEKKAKAGG